MCTACNRNLWSQANLFETRKQNNKHGSLSTSRTRKGVRAFPAGGSELLTALQPKSPECHTAVTQSSQTISLGRPHFQILSKFTRNSPKGFSVRLPTPRTLSPSKNYPSSPPYYAPRRPKTCKQAGCDFALACSQLPGESGC